MPTTVSSVRFVIRYCLIDAHFCLCRHKIRLNISSMSSPSKVAETEIISAIPPVICNNPREKIEPEEVAIEEVLKHLKYVSECKEADKLMLVLPSQHVLRPIPRYPLSIEWSPSVIFFEIDNSFILQRIRILNACSRSIYILCCGLWGETARLGATWRCYPRTRVLLSPGLTADLFIQATPKEQSPVPSAQIAIQLAAAHKRDPVVGYFVVPVVVKFQKYIKPYLGEVEASYNSLVT